jgi:hypothetical protein
VSQEFLNCPDIVAIFQQMGGERMAQRVAACRFGDHRFPNSFFDRSLQDKSLEMMPLLFPGLPILIQL